MHTNIATVSLHAWQKDKESEMMRSLLELLNVCDEKKAVFFVKGKQMKLCALLVELFVEFWDSLVFFFLMFID